MGLFRNIRKFPQRIQIFGLSNGLEKCFDCFMLGKASHENRPWITLANEDLLTKNESPAIFVNPDG